MIPVTPTTDTVTQPTAAPTRKVAAGGAAGAVAVLLAFLASTLGLELPGEVVAALTTLLTFGAGYLVKERAESRDVL